MVTEVSELTVRDKVTVLRPQKGHLTFVIVCPVNQLEYKGVCSAAYMQYSQL